MSSAAATTFPVGAVQMYWNNVRLGTPMSQCQLRYSKNTVQVQHPDSGVDIASYKTGETWEIDITIADLKLDQLRYVYDAAAGYTATTFATDNYRSSTSSVIRFKEDHKLDGTSTITVDRSTFDTGTVTVWKTDYSTEYTQGTDFTADAGAGTVKRISGGNITDGQTVWIEYNEAVTVEELGIGGSLFDYEADLKLVHYLDTGKAMQFYFPRAKHIGASDIAISLADAFGGIPMTFRALADLTLAPRNQLAKIQIEA